MPLNDTDLTTDGGNLTTPATKPGAEASACEDGPPKKARGPTQQGKPAKMSIAATATAGNPKVTKSDAVLKLLRSSRGATIAVMMDATGWQAHSVRGFLSGTVKKKLGVTVESETGKDGMRRYRIVDQPKAG